MSKEKHTPAVAIRLLPREQLGQFVHHPDPHIRRAVARRGFKEHLDILVHDPDTWIKTQVLNHGHLEHVKELIKDKNPHVSWLAKDHLWTHRDKYKLPRDEYEKAMAGVD